MRLFDASGRDVGYLLMRNPPAVPQYRSAKLLQVAAVESDKERTSGFEADLGEPLTVDAFRLESMTPQWPERLELALSNACNLQCVMCNGELSSSIRIHREHRTALPTVAGEREGFVPAPLGVLYSAGDEVRVS